MALATFSVRMDEDLKRQFDTLCADFGMNATTAFNVFARAVVRERRIPFEIRASNREDAQNAGMQAFEELRAQAKKNGIQDMTIEEINDEIAPFYSDENMARLRKSIAQMEAIGGTVHEVPTDE